MRWLLFSILFCFLFNLAKAQEKTHVQYYVTDTSSLPQKFRIKKQFSSKEKATQSLSIALNRLYTLGYIEASIDSFTYQENILKAYLYLGKPYQLSALENGNLSEEVIKKIKFNQENYQQSVFSFVEIEKLQKEILSYYENRGYPFAEVYLDSFQLKNQNVVSKLYAKPNELFLIDTLIVEGNTKTKSKYLQNYLAIKQGDAYDKSKIDKISEKLAQLSFLIESRKAQVVFNNGKASVYVFVQKQKSNQVDLLLGIAPNSSLTKNKVNITGDGRLHLRNSFGVGEEIYLDFKQLKPRTQNLDIQFNYPYLLNLPFGLAGDFSLFKNDTLFLNLDSKAAVHYAFNGLDFIQLFYQNKLSNVLNYDTAKVRSSGLLPEILDITNHRFGVALHFQKLDYVLNPRKGFLVHVSGDVGTKKIRENASLKTIQSDIYANTKLKSINFSFHTKLEYHIPILKKHSFLLANNSKFFISKNILANEKYRLGGAKRLRGFDEDEIYTPYYSLFTLEYHFLLSKNTYFYAFGDMALVQDIRFKTNKIDTPFGFGVGAALETKGGIFSLSYALGKQLDNKIEIKNGKIHFGYINLF